ncbi:MAG: TonB-dependent receptor [Candidatus Zixiibacteriota bacterium]
MRRHRPTAHELIIDRVHEMTPRLLALLLAYLLLYEPVMSQTLHSIEGRVLDLTTRRPIAGATIEIDGRSILSAADEDGRFIISDLDSAEYQVSVSHVGYHEVIRYVSLRRNATEHIAIFLEPRTIPVDGITVTATPFSEDKFVVPAGVSVTPREKFTERFATTTAEVLREEPGVLVQKTTAGHGAPLVRGLIGKHVLLLYDGVRLNKPTFRSGGNQYLNTIDLGSLEKIELLRGPSSVMYGSEAMGGTINLIPMQAPPAGEGVRLHPRFCSQYSSADNGRSVHMNLNRTCNRVSASIGGTYRKVGDLHAGGEIGDQVPTGWEETAIRTCASYRIADRTTLKLDYLAVRQNNVPRYDNYVTGDYQQYVYDPQDRDLGVLTVESKLLCSFVHSVRLNVSYQREIEGRIQQRTGKSDITTDIDRIATWGNAFQMSTMILPSHWLSVGWEYYFDKINSERYTVSNGTKTCERGAYPDDSRYRSAGFFIQDEYTIRRRLRFTLGARYSYFEMESPLEDPFGLFLESYQNLTGAAALCYELLPTANLMASWSRGFRAPSLNDAVVLKKSSSGVDAPSFGLNPEISNNFEAGVKLQRSSMNGSLFLYYNQLSGLIDRKPGIYDGKTFYDENGNGEKDPSEYDIYQRTNVGDSRIYGFEFDYAAWITRMLELRANSFWTFGENQTDHEPLSRIPPLMGMLSLRAHTSMNSWIEGYVRAAGSQRRLSQRDIDDTRISENGTPSWATLNLRSEIRFGDITLNAGIQNITDSEYKEHGSGVYSAGRSFSISLRIEPEW